MPNSRFAIHGLRAFFASNSRFMRLFQAALDTCLDSPFFASLSVHCLHFTVYVPSRKFKTKFGALSFRNFSDPEKGVIGKEVLAEDVRPLQARADLRLTGRVTRALRPESPPKSLLSRAHTKGLMQPHVLLRRVLRRFSNSKCFLEGFLECAL